MKVFSGLSTRCSRRASTGGVVLSSLLLSLPAGFVLGDEIKQDRFELDPMLVTAAPAPRNASDYTTLASSVDEAELAGSSTDTLGALLSELPGVHNSGFAPGAGRPVIRGFSGPRVQILEDGLGVMDVSATSDDHAVGSEAFLASSIEVLRGPATLLYGGNAIGGVVNIINKTAPLAPLASPHEGRAFAQYDSGSDGWTAGGAVATGTPQWALRIGTLAQRQEDYRLPSGFRFDEEHHHDEEHHDADEHGDAHGEPARKLANSFADRETLQLGFSRFFGNGGRFSVFGAQRDALYGVPGHLHAHEDHEHDEEDHDEGHDEAAVRIDMQSRRAGGTIDLPLKGALFERAKVDFVYSDYEHRELEGEHIGTTFTRESRELRFEMNHRSILGTEGVLGAHFAHSELRAVGAEAFTPPTDAGQAAVFWLGEQRSETLSFQHGLRLEWQKTQVEHARHDDYDGLAASAASGIRWQLNERDSLGAQVSLSQRHPTESELFAEGPHLASGRFEIGDPDLDVETAAGLDFTYRAGRGPLALLLAGYLYRFEDYIHAAPTGAERESLPVYRHFQQDALIYGTEAELTVHLLDEANERLHLILTGDWARLQTLGDDDALPRNPPARVRAALFYERGILAAELGVSRVFSQDYLASFETKTSGHTLVDLRISTGFETNGRSLLVFLEGNNLTDEVALNHLSYFKENKPLPGRRVSAGILVRF